MTAHTSCAPPPQDPVPMTTPRRRDGFQKWLPRPHQAAPPDTARECTTSCSARMSKADKSPGSVVELPSPAMLRHPFFGQPRSGSSLRRRQAPRSPKLTTTEAPAGADDLPNRRPNAAVAASALCPFSIRTQQPSHMSIRLLRCPHSPCMTQRVTVALFCRALTT